MVSTNESIFMPLESLLVADRPSELLVGFRGDDKIYWDQWRLRVEAWRRVVSNCDAKKIALFHTDAIEFSAILFALWAEKRIAVVPANAQPITIEQLVPIVDGFVGEIELKAISNKDYLSLDPKSIPNDLQIQSLRLNTSSLVLEVFTSGSSGQPEAIPKLFFQLSNEVNNLHLLWGDLLVDAALFSTVSHHHIYGLLFRVLWPLAAGRPFDAKMCEYLEDINKRASQWNRVVVISSPTHLSRLPQLTDWSSIKTLCSAIFSSGAPLPRIASIEVKNLFNIAPIEVYGSSETGGIGFRQQSAEAEILWQTVPGVNIAIDPETQCLQIQSSYLADEQWFLTSDQVVIQNQTHFQLLGRVDRIVKVEGKRLSLTEMERRIQEHPLVDSARVIVLGGKRATIGAVIILTAEGKKQLLEMGKRPLNILLSEYLLEQFERPVIPRRWRYPQQLPKDTQGKVLLSALTELFNSETAEGDSSNSNLSSRPIFPEVVSVNRIEDGVNLEIKIPENLLYFDGHFDGAAILPGVVQVHWAEHYGREYCSNYAENGRKMGFVGEFSHLEAIKFQHVIRPNSLIQLSLNYTPANGKLHFNYQSNAGNHSSGRFATKLGGDSPAVQSV